MLRYFALAALIVLTFIALLTRLPAGRAERAGSPRYVTATGTPGPPQRDAFARVPQAVTGAAPWALSALPECFRQLSSARGVPSFAHRSVPPGARRIPGGATLRVADCTLKVGSDSARVTRGENALQITAPVRLYVAGRRLVLDRFEGGREEVRTFALVAAASGSFAIP